MIMESSVADWRVRGQASVIDDRTSVIDDRTSVIDDRTSVIDDRVLGAAAL